MLSLAFVGGELETHLSHAFGTFTGFWSAMFAILACPVAVLLVEFLSAALSLLLETLDNIDCATSGHRDILVVWG